MDFAAERGHLRVVKWLHENQSEGCTSEAIDNAACNSHLDVVRWLVTHRTEMFTESGMVEAAWNGHLQVFYFLYDNRDFRSQLVHHTLRSAADQGHLEVVKFLIYQVPMTVKMVEIFMPDKVACKWVNERLSKMSRTKPKIEQVEARREISDAFDWFRQYDRGSHCVVSCILGNALRRGHHGLVGDLVSRLDDERYMDQIKLAADYSVPLTRWLVEHGPQLDKNTGVNIVMEGMLMEATRFISESNQAFMVRVVLADEWVEGSYRSRVVLSILDHTRFEEENARRNICNALRQAPAATRQWI